jgi:hypothetical protein
METVKETKGNGKVDQSASDLAALVARKEAEAAAPVGGGHPTLVRALIAAQRRAKAVAKNAENTFHKYKYASADAIIDEASECLAAEGLAVFPVSVGRDPEQVDHVWQIEKDKNGEDASFIVTPRRILAVYQLIHESGEEREFRSSTPVIPEKGRPEDKAEFGARTENLGYALRDLLLIPREDQAKETPSARDDRNAPPPRAPAAARHDPQPPPNPRPWMPRLVAAINALKLGEDAADRAGLKGKERDERIKGAKLLYIAWCAGRDTIKSTLDLTDAEAAEVVRRAEAGETP